MQNLQYHELVVWAEATLRISDAFVQLPGAEEFTEEILRWVVMVITPPRDFSKIRASSISGMMLLSAIWGLLMIM